PGDLVHFNDPPGWNVDAWHYDKVFRVFEVRLSGTAASATAENNRRAPRDEYRMKMSVRLEQQTDLKTPRLPTFVEPRYPVLVEGVILSSIGDQDKPDRTYDPKKDSSTSLFEYRVKVPLWKDDAPEIPAPYNPGRMPGQLFFPAYQGERVLVA